MHGVGTSLVIQWLWLCASSAGGVRSILGQGTEIPTCHAVWTKTNQKNNCMVLAPKLTNSSVERIESSELYTYVGNLFLTKVQKKRQGSRKRITFSRKLCARIGNLYDPLHQKKKKKNLGSILYITYKKINLKRTLGLNVNVKPKNC